MLLLPVLIGALVGGAAFAQERERDTQVYALTQSVGRTRWYLTKCTVVIAPLVLMMIGVGLLAEWARGAAGLAGFSSLGIPEFQSAGVVPAVFMLLSFGVALPVGLLLRSTVSAIALALAMAGVLVAGLGYTLYTDLVPHDRISYAADRDAFVPIPDGSLLVDSGYLNAAGSTDAGQGFSCQITDGATNAEFAVQWQACLDRAGIVARYTEYIDGARRTQLTLTLSGICAAFAALGLTLGWARVRRRIL